MEWVNSIRGPNLTIFFQYITWLGYKDFLFLFVPFCYWFFDRKLFGIFTLFVFISALANAYLKDFFQDPRPENILNLDPYLSALGPSYGFPSGHAQLAVVIWGFIFLHTQNNLIKFGSLFLIIFISFSRIYLGVHDVSDVAGGIVFGLISILLLKLLLSDKNKWLRSLNKMIHFVIYSSLLIFIFLIWPAESDRIIVVALGSLIIGFWFGHTIDNIYFNFHSPKNIALKILSAALALVGFILLNSKINQLFELTQINHGIEVFISSLTLGLYISILAPLILSLMKLQYKADVQ